MEYVYVYMHPKYPYLYVGRTCDLEKRIKSHDTNDNDNIAREHERLLQEAAVWYIPLQNKAESTIVEAYLINKHKPYLNKALNYESISDSLVLSIPEYIRMDESLQKLHTRYGELQDDVSKKTQRIKEMEEIKQELTCTEERLQALRNECQQKKQECEILSDILNDAPKNGNIWFTSKEVKWIMDNCGVDVAFYAGSMDINTGKKMYFKLANKGKVKSGYLRSSEDDCGWQLYFEGEKESVSSGAFDVFVGANKYVSDNPTISSIYLKMLQENLEKRERVKNNIHPYTAEQLLQNDGHLPDGIFSIMDDDLKDSLGNIRITIKNGKIKEIHESKDMICDWVEHEIQWLEKHSDVVFYDERLEEQINNALEWYSEKIKEFEQRQGDIQIGEAV